MDFWNIFNLIYCKNVFFGTHDEIRSLLNDVDLKLFYKVLKLETIFFSNMRLFVLVSEIIKISLLPLTCVAKYPILFLIEFIFN